jgi:hypothetical protein
MVVGTVIEWPLPGSGLVRGCVMLLPATVLWTWVCMEQPVVEGRHL